MAEKPEKIQMAQGVAGLLDTVNNTSLKKHPMSLRDTLCRSLLFCVEFSIVTPD
jgi:hypothetical protein